MYVCKSCSSVNRGFTSNRLRLISKIPGHSLFVCEDCGFLWEYQDKKGWVQLERHDGERPKYAF